MKSKVWVKLNRELAGGLLSMLGFNFVLFLKDLFILYLGVFAPCMYVCHMCEMPMKAGTRVVDGCEPLCECWEWNPGPLPKQRVLLTAKPSLLSVLSFGVKAYHLVVFSVFTLQVQTFDKTCYKSPNQKKPQTQQQQPQMRISLSYYKAHISLWLLTLGKP